ncbi:MAG: thermonuclease family protein [Sphingomicrobium sp.]
MRKQWSQDNGGRRLRRWARSVPRWAGAALAGTVYGSGWIGALPTHAATGSIRANFGTCHTGGGTNCVVDGDTLWLGGQKIRVADIDAPETHGPRCPAEQELGDRATQRLRQLLNGGAVSLQAIDRDIDRYGRKLRIVLVDGRSVGDILVDEGLARPYAGGRRPWC